MIATALLLRGLAALVYAGAAAHDVRTRRAPDAAWIAIATLGIAALAIEAATLGTIVGVVLLVVVVAIATTVGFSRGFIGGADAKAAMVLPIAFPRLPGTDPASGVFGTLHQGFEVLMVVCAVAGLVGLAISSVGGDDIDERGIPFLVPIFAGVVALAVA